MHNVASVESSIYSNYIDRVLGLLVFKGEGTSEVTVLKNVSLLVFTECRLNLSRKMRIGRGRNRPLPHRESS